MSEFSSIQQNIHTIRENMAPYPDAKLMAVIKTRTPEEINYAVRECGITLLGENRVQELLAHYPDIDHTAKLHFIGSLQTNKVKYIIDKVDMIESVDREAIAFEIDRQAAKIGKVMPILIEINIGKEESKGGLLPELLPTFCEFLKSLPHLAPMGLMAIPPKTERAEDAIPYFHRMQNLLQSVFHVAFPTVEHPILSMGMSESYKVALENGSHIIRIGTGIFGKRNLPYKK